MDLKQIMATLAVLGSGATLACDSGDKADVKEVDKAAPAKADEAKAAEKKDEAKPAEKADAAKPAEAAKVVQAVAVPEDTEDLKTAKGQDVDKMPGAEVKKNKRGGGGGGSSRSGGGSSSKPSGTKKRKDGKISLSDSDDPLG